ncbi:hypothetical protein BIV60_14385 [Bacillus sp. MUM 116]|uniref:hypothetical protein n=1 Tax=Bacillus sp. MUM 116 TaxID=1678002 RepID=UPI0008F5D4FF|nr:hypothetical protein [Bacillus sp. MUM 116]OIK13272.1 hypothetical protein BIV60_14385 [Bacillus sp. MUM 116]
MKSFTQFTSILALFFLLAFAAYLDSPFSFINKNHSYTATAIKQKVARPVTAAPSDEGPDLEEKLEKVEKVDGYFVETYQEYEVYKDDKGKVIKEIPTDHTETLKYWDYSQNNGE